MTTLITYKGRVVETIWMAMEPLYATDDREGAREFMQGFRDHSPEADKIVAYIAAKRHPEMKNFFGGESGAA